MNEQEAEPVSMNKAYQRLEEIAREHGLTPRFLREIVYLFGVGYKNKHVLEKTGYSQKTVTKYRRWLRNLDDDDAAEVLRLVAEIKKPVVE